jgi:hypothetical protein
MKARLLLAVFAIALITIPVAAGAPTLFGLSTRASVVLAAPPAPKPTKTPRPTNTATRTYTPRPIQTPTRTPARSATNTATETLAKTALPTDTAVLTQAPTDTPSPTDSPTQTATSAPTDTPMPSSVAQIYWGVNLSGVPWDIDVLENWETKVATDPDDPQTHKHVSIVNYGHFWGDSGSQTGYREFSWSVGPLNNIRAHGSIPMISWTPEGGNITWQLSDIIEGKHDAYIARFAQGLKNWQGGAPIFLRVMHEMNGNWGYPWQEDYTLNARGEFVKAWQHIVAIFRENGANNASFVWCPNVEYAGSTWPTFDSLWPEDDLHPNEVDWTCLDGYNKNEPWLTFDQLFRYAYDEIVKSAKINHFGPKPVMLGEWGSVDGSGRKAGWLTDALTVQLPDRYPRVRAQVYYNFQDGNYDWRLETVDSSRTAWSAGILRAYYASNTFGSLAAPIPVP